jgi:dual specificity tyrosine-phosphorylation-regulated kinase 1
MGTTTVRMLENFVYRNHQCIVFELLSYNLYDLLKDTRFHGVSLNLIRKFARQLLQTLGVLLPPGDDQPGVIHCDLVQSFLL